ncbi:MULTISPECIES: hypothetical protein [Bacillus cereus group]|uniref:Uncharacterized protein n=1 Tax=Bacillus cereus HuA4-10 TaxID=1053206 RepID=J8DJW3_BACCE|nr:MULTISPECIES: hypothetical protein [Bacillus cereus group]EJQ76475.1 hypothetical protein IGC_04385 [Bacillus cereus HuA4-10]MBJ8005818.1 hypothetical protein [Bacillus cereus]QWI48438.1 hypothetical protein EXW56_05675 [Bacillus mycoides]WJE21328.1 hypothetical protein QRY07_06145 [Bacillus cereus]
MIGIPHYIIPVQVHPYAIDTLEKEKDINILSVTPVVSENDMNQMIISSNISIQLRSDLYVNISVDRADMNYQDEVEYLQMTLDKEVPFITNGNPKKKKVFETFFNIKGNIQCELLMEEDQEVDLSLKKVLYTAKCGTGMLLKNEVGNILIACHEFCMLLVTRDQEKISNILRNRYNKQGF